MTRGCAGRLRTRAAVRRSLAHLRQRLFHQCRFEAQPGFAERFVASHEEGTGGWPPAWDHQVEYSHSFSMLRDSLLGSGGSGGWSPSLRPRGRPGGGRGRGVGEAHRKAGPSAVDGERFTAVASSIQASDAADRTPHRAPVRRQHWSIGRSHSAHAKDRSSSRATPRVRGWR